MENFQNRLNLFWLWCRGGFTAASSPAPKENAELQEMAKLSAHKGFGEEGCQGEGNGPDSCCTSAVFLPLRLSKHKKDNTCSRHIRANNLADSLPTGWARFPGPAALRLEVSAVRSDGIHRNHGLSVGKKYFILMLLWCIFSIKRLFHCKVRLEIYFPWSIYHKCTKLLFETIYYFSENEYSFVNQISESK